MSFDQIVIAASLSRHEALILEAITRAKGRFVTSRKIAEHVYADKADGGPDSAESLVKVTMFRIRYKLGELDSRLVVEGQTNTKGYRLLFLGKPYYGYRLTDTRIEAARR